jgi:ElaB/YqjD/DUF883 family membrane-anchored ribosome-binding protein
MGEAAGEVTRWEDRPEGETTGSMDDEIASDPQVEAIVVEIDETRDEMSATVEQIGDRLDPRNVVADAKQTVRDATVGKVEDMAQTATEMIGNAGQTAQEAGGGLVEMVRRNPMPAALVGIGLGWMAISARNQGGMNRSWQSGSSDSWGRRQEDWRYGGSYDTARSTAYSGTSGYSGGNGGGIGDKVGQVTDQVGERVGQVGDTAGQAVANVQHTAQDMAHKVGQTAGEVPQQAQQFAREVGDNAGRVFQDNPLAVGAIALAVGTAVGLVLPATQKEREVLGEARDQVIDKAETAASQALGQMEQQAQQV